MDVKLKRDWGQVADVCDLTIGRCVYRERCDSDGGSRLLIRIPRSRIPMMIGSDCWITRNRH